jgi:lysophospholipase L1-like esterase
VGSSSFTRWTDVKDYFPGYTIVNRGFGGSTLADVLRYEEDVIFKYNPKQIVIYCGENDVASSDTITANTVFNRFTNLFSDIRAVYPNVPVVFVSLKPSPSRWQLREKAKATNQMIEQYLGRQKNTQFIDVWKPMLGKDGKPRPELFVEDNLHMNAQGYAIWQKLIQPTLLKD